MLLAAKVKSVRKRTTVSAAAGTSQGRSLVDWKKLSCEALSLACNAINIDSTGSPAVLSQRLFDHYNLLHITAPVVEPPVVEPPVVQPPVTTVDYTQHSSSTVNVSLNSSSTFVAPSVSNIPSDLNTPSDSNIPLFQGFDIQTFLRQELRSFLSQELPRALPQQRSATVSSSFLPIVPPTIHNGIPTTISPELPPSITMSNLFSPLNTATATTTTGSPVLPPISSAVLEQIQARKFIKFDSLLPATSPLTLDEYVIKVSSGLEPAVSLVPKAQNRPRVYDFHTWMSAWNNFLQAMSYYHPQCISDLLWYQSTITSFASQYSFSAWYTYEQLFRYHMANDHTLSWGTVDNELFNRFLRGASLRANCFSCRNYGHIASNCPLRSSASGSSSTENFQQTQMLPFRAPQRNQFFRDNRCTQRLTCRFFNNNGQCTSTNCQFEHVCQGCFGPHPQFKCTRSVQRQ